MTALDFFDVPDDGAAAHATGYAQSDNPHGFSTPEGIEWARRWGSAEVGSRRAAGTYGATDEDYRAGGLVPPERTASGMPKDLLAGFSSLYRTALEEAEATARAMHYAAAMTRRIIGSTSLRFDPNAIAALYGVPSSILGFGPVVSIVDEPSSSTKSPAHPPTPLEWKTTKRKDLVAGAVNADPKDSVLRRYLLDEKGPLEVEGWYRAGPGGIVSSGVRRLEQMRATMQEPRPELRAPKHLGTAPTTRSQTARSRRRKP